jgi:hypothetical protein
MLWSQSGLKPPETASPCYKLLKLLWAGLLQQPEEGCQKQPRELWLESTALSPGTAWGKQAGPATEGLLTQALLTIVQNFVVQPKAWYCIGTSELSLVIQQQTSIRACLLRISAMARGCS